MFMFRVKRSELPTEGCTGEWIVAESRNYYLYGSYECVYLVSQKNNRAITQVGDFYGDVQAGIIDPDERFCVTVGCGYIIYYLKKPFKGYEYDKITDQWSEGGRGPQNIHWIEDLKQISPNEVELTDEFGNKEILKIPYV